MPYADRDHALVRARRRDRDAQMRGTPPHAAPVCDGPLRPAARRRDRASRRHARGRAAVRPARARPRCPLHRAAHPGRGERREPDLDRRRARARSRRPLAAWPRAGRRNSAAGRSSTRCRHAPARKAGTRSARRSSAPSWKPSPICRTTSSTGSYSPLPPVPRQPRLPGLPGHGSRTSRCRSRTSSPQRNGTARRRRSQLRSRLRRSQRRSGSLPATPTCGHDRRALFTWPATASPPVRQRHSLGGLAAASLPGANTRRRMDMAPRSQPERGTRWCI